MSDQPHSAKASEEEHAFYETIKAQPPSANRLTEMREMITERLASASAQQGEENERKPLATPEQEAWLFNDGKGRIYNELQSAQTRPATVEPQMKDELPLPVRLRNLAQYAEDGPQSRMVTDMIALMREAADLLNRQSPPPVEGEP
jgi:hypothetical protein